MVATMALDYEIARLSKILVDTLGITFEEAQARLRALKLEIVVGSDATSTAAHAAVLTAVSVGRRSFVGGVRVVGAVGQRTNSLVPIPGYTLAEKCEQLGACPFEGAPTCRVGIGAIRVADEVPTFLLCWNGWNAGVRRMTEQAAIDDGQNPLTGIAAGALGVGAAFEFARGRTNITPADVDLWGAKPAPLFEDVFLPNALWLVGLGNLGQAFLWAMAFLPYEDPRKVSLMLQDDDRVTPENWGTSVLVLEETYGMLKGKVAEKWAEKRGFDIRRTDRRLTTLDRRADGEPMLAICGLDRIESRRSLASVGFAAIIDAGLGRTADDFDQFVVRVFDQNRSIDRYFDNQTDAKPIKRQEGAAYERLKEEIGQCGVAGIGSASVAVPYVSAVAAAMAISRAIALASDCPCVPTEVRRISAASTRKRLTPVAFQTRGIGHAGRPVMIANKSIEGHAKTTA
jgi:hypothetical protein